MRNDKIIYEPLKVEENEVAKTKIIRRRTNNNTNENLAG